VSDIRRVLIVQHGEKESGPGDPELTARGRQQAAAGGAPAIGPSRRSPES